MPPFAVCRPDEHDVVGERAARGGRASSGEVRGLG
jgi:hypothetical protein